MKTKIKKYLPEGLFCWFLISLMVPNVLLSIGEPMPFMAKAANILLPLGVIGILATLSDRIGRTVWLMFPLVFLAAFQIVVIGLYGNGVIGVDMFLNVATTNSSEVDELLSSLAPSITFVVLLYVPSLVIASIMIARKRRLSERFIHKGRRTAIVLAVFGVMAMATGYAEAERNETVEVKEHIYPANAVYNAWMAYDRENKQKNYAKSSADFSFATQSLHPGNQKEIVIMVVGETSRASEWELCGYERQTNPQLSARDDIYFWREAVSESNTTHKSVPMLLSTVNANDFEKEIYSAKSVVTAFNEAGYHTVFISNQQPNHSFIEYFANEADTTLYMKPGKNGGNAPDIRMLPVAEKFMYDNHPKTLLVLHTYGSHFNYSDRYNQRDRLFIPDDCSHAAPSSRRQLVNAYDNSIVATDRLLNSLIEAAEDHNCVASLIYTSDHGEDIFDNGSIRFLHASPRPTYEQVHVPFLVWLSPAYREMYPDVAANLSESLEKRISSSEAFTPTAMQLAGLASPRLDEKMSLASGKYTEHPFIYLNDHNEPVALKNILQ